MSELQFGDLNFDESFLFAWRGDEEVRFTRQERALLLALTASPRKLLHRAILLDAIADAGSDVSERNVDFLVNRLRSKLGDSARSPRYIATQYGEGYVWIAERAEHKPLEAFLVVGPVFGLGPQRVSTQERRFLESLRRALDKSLPRERKVVVAEAWQPYSGAGHKVRYFLETSFHEDGRAVHCAIILRDWATRQILHATRLTLEPDDLALLDRKADEAAAGLKGVVWDHLAMPAVGPSAPTDEPLELRVHNAAVLLGGPDRSWLESGAQLARARIENPGDARTTLMWCMHLYSRLVVGGREMTAATCREIEGEIEALVFEILPSIQRDPYLVLGAAKLLFYIHRGHIGLAEALAAEAFAQTTAFAAAFTILGQIKAARGHIAEAVRLYDRGIELSEPNSEFHVYILVLKLIALMASGDLDAVEKAEGELQSVKPGTRLELGLFSARPDRALPDDLAQVLEMLPEAHARALITYLYNTSARHFIAAEHRDNVLRAFVTHLGSRFDGGMVDDQLAKAKAGDATSGR